MVIDPFEEMRDAFRDLVQTERAPVFEPDGVAIDVDKLQAYSGQQSSSGWRPSIWDGGKFFGGFPTTDVWVTDYWTLRARSAQLFTSNLYARGLIRRLVTNEINTGLMPEACPDKDILGIPDEDRLNAWTEMTENRFGIWAQSPKLCDYYGVSTLGAIQRDARREALVCGDVLVVLRHSQRTGLPAVQLIPGDRVQNPLIGDTPKKRDIRYGVEYDKRQQVVAYWVRQIDGTSKRLPAWGEKSGRQIAWLVYGSDKRYDDVRGMPLLSLILQSAQDIDRYRDAMQRKATNNATIMGYIERDQPGPGSMAISGGAVRKDTASLTDADGKTRELGINQVIPGTFLENMAPGEKLVAFSTKGTDEAFGSFEEAIASGIAWANEVPPEIYRLTFSNNYSASQAAINEFRMYLNLVWSDFGEQFCTPIYIDHLLSETLTGRNPEIGLLNAWRDYARQYDVFGAWTAVQWYGSIKPSTDMLKQARASQFLVGEGWSTNAREARVLTGTKFSKNIQRLKQENQQKVEAAIPLAEFRKEYGIDVSEIVSTSPGTSAAADALLTATNGD